MGRFLAKKLICNGDCGINGTNAHFAPVNLNLLQAMGVCVEHRDEFSYRLNCTKTFKIAKRIYENSGFYCFSSFTHYEKIKGRLWDHPAACVSVCVFPLAKSECLNHISCHTEQSQRRTSQIPHIINTKTTASESVTVISLMSLHGLHLPFMMMMMMMMMMIIIIIIIILLLLLLFLCTTCANFVIGLWLLSIAHK
jgi:hypothetical protein